jgi:hypothetical protein
MNGGHHPVGSPSAESGRVKIDYAELRRKAVNASPGEWSVWTETTPTKDLAIDELAYQVMSTPDADFAEAVYLINANGKCPALTGCGPTSSANAAYIVAAQPSTVLALLDRIEELEGGRKQEVGIGMAIAAAIVMRCWGDDTYASEILGAAGYRTVADLRADGVEWYDIRALAPVLHGFREKDRARAARKALSGEKKP